MWTLVNIIIISKLPMFQNMFLKQMTSLIFVSEHVYTLWNKKIRLGLSRLDIYNANIFFSKANSSEKEHDLLFANFYFLNIWIWLRSMGRGHAEYN